jgi:hypothetical protein
MSSEVTASAVEAIPVQDEAPKAQPANLSAPKKEETKEIEKVAPKEDLNYSSKFAALSRREKQVLEREKKFKEQELSYKQQLEKVNGWESRKAELKKNPDLIFEELGMSFDDLINLKLGITPEPKVEDPNERYTKLEKEMREEMQKLKEEREGEKKAKQVEFEAQDAQILDSFKNDIKNVVTSQADKYELINYQNDFDLVFDVIEEYYNVHGEILDTATAADKVEEYLENLVEGVTKLKKFSTKFAPKSEPQAPVKEAPKTEQVKDQKPKTLSNNLNATSSNYKLDGLGIEESKKKAATLLRWT